ncbi:MAG: DUF4252 domain-containing protein [Bacteroidaceae bacterium]|nr:DUF4252 domain-containing protein [Bacteroidaceae bacterium]
MKSRILFAAILLTTLALGSCSLRSHPFKALGHIEDVHHVHIPNWVMALAGPGKRDLGKELDSINVKSLRDLYVYSTDNKQAADKLYKEARRIAKSNGYELALKASEEGEHADIYVKQKGKRTSLMIIGKEDDGETDVVSLSAKISADDLAKLITPNP